MSEWNEARPRSRLAASRYFDKAEAELARLRASWKRADDLVTALDTELRAARKVVELAGILNETAEIPERRNPFGRLGPALVHAQTMANLRAALGDYEASQK